MFPLKDDLPAHRRPIITVALIISCVLVFLWQTQLDAHAGFVAVHIYGFIPAELFGDGVLPADITVVPPAATLLTSMFLHGGLMHLGGNMLYLWVFGRNVEDSLGHVRFLIFYVLCGIAAAFAQAFPDPESAIPMIGASGAISGVLGAYLILFPHARVHVIIPFGFMFLHTVRAGWLLAFWFVYQLLSGLIDQGEGGVAWWAHVGGFVAGMALVFVMRDRRRKLWPHRSTRTRLSPRRKNRGRSYMPRVSRRRPGPWG
ncbi:MAG: rhomboid family intramembrane serine protease [Pseudomonadota bacterium]